MAQFNFFKKKKHNQTYHFLKWSAFLQIGFMFASSKIIYWFTSIQYPNLGRTRPHSPNWLIITQQAIGLIHFTKTYSNLQSEY